MHLSVDDSGRGDGIEVGHAAHLDPYMKCCVPIVHPDGRTFPFDTYNMSYRDGK
jgi:hypothetical protein